MKNNSNTQEKDLQNTDSQEVKKNKEIKGNVPLIIKLEDYIFKKYDLRLNTVSNELDGKFKGEKEFKIFNEDKITYDLYSSGFNKFNQMLPVIIAEKVPKYDPIKNYFESLPK